jgi:uncharacterized membrane protein
MNELFDYAPNIHPMVVHFPIAILILAIGLNLIAFFLPEKWWDEKKTTFIYVLGSIAAIVTYFTGRSAADTVFLPTEAQSLLTDHADWALWTVLFFSAYAIIRIALHWFKKLEKKSVQVVAFVLALPGFFFLFETGEYGATMVYGYGVGTGQYLEEEAIAPAQTENTDLESLFIEKENGDWTWDMSASSVNDLNEHFHWLEGTMEQLSPTVSIANSRTYLSFNLSDHISNFFVTHSAYKNIQIDIYLDMSSFTGDVKIAHHVQDAQNYDFVSLTSNGEMSQGRLENGAENVFDENPYQNTGLTFVRVVADGTHFRGYINKEMVVHGHGDEPTAGSVGLKINGHGTLLIQKIELSQLK